MDPDEVKRFAEELKRFNTDLQNRTWQGFDFHQPVSADGLAAFLERTPGHSLA